MTPTSSGIGPSIVRTVIPLIVGFLLTWALKAGFDLDDDSVTNVVTVIVTGVYYALVRFLEVHVNPSLGWLLGLAKPPVYVSPDDMPADVEVVDSSEH